MSEFPWFPGFMVGLSSSSAQALRTITLSLTLALAPVAPFTAGTALAFAPSSPIAPSLSAGAAFVIDASNGEVLLERDADERRSIASTTKIMSAVVALDHVPADQLDKPFTVGRMRARPGQTVMGLRTGDTVTVRQLLYGMLLPSGNDAADVLAEHVAGSKEQFVALMNTTAHILGMKNTRFANPSGLDEWGHYSTARDMAVLARHAMQYRAFAEVAGERSVTINDGRDQAARELQNLNLPLFYYPGVTGVKPGWTPGAGICQVVSVTLDGRSVIAVLLNTASEAADMTRLLDWLYGTRTAPSGERYALSKVFGKGDDGEPWTYYAATNQRVRAGFLHFLDSIGGVNVLGYPISGELHEDGRAVQYFQRARLEWHPNKLGTPYEVQISLLGERMAAARGHLPQPHVAPFESWSTNRYFAETGHSVHDAFLRYFNRIGGIDVLGYPITEELASDVDWAHTVQYFQRGRLQYHPDKAGTPNEVSASFVGEWAYAERYKVPKGASLSPSSTSTSAGIAATPVSATATPVSTPVSTPASRPGTLPAASTSIAATHTPTARTTPTGDRQAAGAVSTPGASATAGAGGTATSPGEYMWSNSLLGQLRDLLRRVR